MDMKLTYVLTTSITLPPSSRICLEITVFLLLYVSIGLWTRMVVLTGVNNLDASTRYTSPRWTQSARFTNACADTNIVDDLRFSAEIQRQVGLQNLTRNARLFQGETHSVWLLIQLCTCCGSRWLIVACLVR